MASSPAESPPSPSEPPPPASSKPPPSNPPPVSTVPPSPTNPPPIVSPPPLLDISPPPPIDISPPPVVISSPPPSVPPPFVPLPPVPVLVPPPPTISPPPPTVTPPPPSLAPPINTPPPSLSPPPSKGPPTRTPSPLAPSLPSPSPPSSSPPPGDSPPAPPPSNNSSEVYPSPPPSLSPPVTNQTDPSPDMSTPSSQNENNNSNAGSTAGIVLGVIVVLSFLGLVVWCIKKRRKPIGRYESGFIMPSNHSSPISSMIMTDSSYPKSPSAPLVYHQRSGSVASEAGLSSNKSWFSYEELHSITNGFSPQNILGEGGFGCVYKGVLSDGREVAVKQLKVGSGQGEREFKAEVEIISRIHHRHLVSLVGYCVSESHRLLVYDFVANGTLESHFHGKGNPPLTWPTRVRIAAGSARGLAYLHEDCHPRIIHRDIKSSNILLDNNFEAQVADFGLARLAMDTHTHVTTRVMGTFGYLAPEYASSGKLTEKSDVFSFGVVLLEIITGRKPVDGTRPLGDESLVEWARPMLNHAIETGEFGELPDPKLAGNYDQTEMFRMIEVAAACVRHSASMRPKMSKVVRVLDSLADTDLDNGIKHGQSEMFNVAKTADIRLLQRLAFGTQEFSSSEFSRSNWSRQSDV